VSLRTEIVDVNNASSEPRVFSLNIADYVLRGKVFGGTQPHALPSIALHGWLDNANSFVPLAEHGAFPGLTLAPDFCGHGQSDHRAPGHWYHFADHLTDVLAVADRFGLTQIDLVGHSMGGALACMFAAALPERVRKLVLIEAIGPLSHVEDICPTELRKALLARARSNSGGQSLRVFADRNAAIEARIGNSGLSERSAGLLVDRGLKEVPSGFSWSSDPRHTLASVSRLTEGQVLATLNAIAAPTLLILADPATAYLEGDLARRRIAALRPTKVIRIKGQHHLHMDCAVELAPEILNFLRLSD
jgi:pimeloyl-ACP methyl ester carboxylesterase